MKKIRKAIIPVAGLGTRFLPFSKSIPKEMLPIVDTPTIAYIVSEIVDSGIDDILLINGRNKVSIIDYFDRSPELEENLKKSGKEDMLKMVQDISQITRVYSVRQKEPQGLGHAILCGRAFIGKEPFAVLLGDDVVYSEKEPAIQQLIDIYEKTGCAVIGVQEVAIEDAHLYGVANVEETDGLLKVVALEEKPDQPKSNLAVIGRYILLPEIFDILEKTPKSVGGEIQLTDALAVLAKEGKVYACVLDGRRYDMGSRQGFLEATIETALRREDLKDSFKDYLLTLVSSLDG